MRAAPNAPLSSGVAGLDVGQRPVGVVVGQVDVPQQRGQGQRGARRDLLVAHPAGLLLGLLLGGAEDDLRRRAGCAGRRRAADGGEAAADVVGEGQRVVEVVAVGGEDDVGVAGGEVAALGGVAGLEDHRVPLGAARQARA